ncbi:hypothetical protein E4A47_02580 [Micrococcus flavus]|uniref:DUF2267 domain-containing protein n=1 Tax=Micrococcus flavus TaxID=384602 RepID=A0A4Y8X4E2_9MICC|nr:hypothetical protein [Micrococcus flavus]MBB4883125.1 hypothetical protein [Micrococcus flavus]TFI04533.1 hypothetical protein E4A47_02580 [Micrococcus flavus]GGK42607.1 hypothetical protein GCM10007073_07060 [Micrococcus flavus]
MPSHPVPASSDRDAGRHGGVDERRVGLIADPGVPWTLAQEVAETLPDRLAERHEDEVRWSVEARRQVLPVSADGHLVLDGEAARLAEENDWDTVVAVVDLPRFDEGRGVLADVLPGRRAASVCVPALGVLRTRSRLEETVVRVLEYMDAVPAPDVEMEVSESDGEASEGVGREHITPVPDTELHGSGRHPDLSTVFVKGPGGTLRLLLGMVAANRPLRLARGMKWAVASAGAAGAYGVFFGSIWSLSNQMSTPRLTGVSALAVIMLVLWLTTTNGLWVRGGRHGGRPALDNLSTLATVGLACSALYAALFAVLAVVATVIIPMPYLSAQLNEDAGWADMMRLVWLSTSMGTMAGAVGAGFDDAERIRTATYSRRELERRRLADDGGDDGPDGSTPRE